MFKSKFHIISLFVLILLIHVILGVFYTGYSPGWVGFVIIIYFLILLLGSVFIRLQFYVKSQLRLPLLKIEIAKGMTQLIHKPKKVALTFDDGPTDRTNEILDILLSKNIKATFFIIGKHIEGRESILKRMFDEGHIIGNHSFEHGRHFDWKSSRNMIEEIEKTNNLISEITGKKPELFRPPYGVTNPNVARAIRILEMKSVAWNIRSFDTVATSESKLLNRLCRQIKPGAIVLLHDRCEITVKILPKFIDFILKNGYGFELV